MQRLQKERKTLLPDVDYMLDNRYTPEKIRRNIGKIENLLTEWNIKCFLQVEIIGTNDPGVNVEKFRLSVGEADNHQAMKLYKL